MRPLVLLVAGLLGGTIPALSQPKLSVFDDKVVVTASADSQSVDEVPAAVTVIDGREIEARQARTLADLIATVPGAAVARAGAAGQQTSVFIRGTNSNQTLLLWNGIPLNDPFFGGVNWQFVPTDGIERVEVVRGPFSALYGSDAMGGVVQVLTGSRRGGTVTLEGGGDGYLRSGVAAGADLGGSTRVDLTGDLRRGSGRVANEGFDSEELVARALWAMSPGASFGLLLRGDDSSTGVPFSSGVPTPRSKISWRERELAAPVNFDQARWTVDGQLSRTTFNAGFRSPDDPFGPISSDTESSALRGRAVASYHALADPGHDLRLALGADAARLEVTNASSAIVNLDRAHQRTWAAFAEASYGAGPVHLQLGARRDDNSVYGGQTSWRAGGVVRIARHTLLRASYGQAFRAPTLGELFFPGSGNPALRPETGTSYEAAIEQEVGPWRFALTGFENRQRNLITFDLATFSDLNIGRARSRGVEGEVTFRRGIVLARLNGTRLSAINQTTGLDLLRRPRSSANLVLAVRPGVWTLNLVGRYVGGRADFDPATFARRRNPAFATIDLAARRRLLPWLSPYLRLDNAADRDYEEVLGYPSPRRTLAGGVAVEF
ncbi:MAG TPA: TonB-dependent receptor [Thermoanaerobaculia bacterium]|nr:TonB-dependent receptor [Thermoanaerobaculia bacterium]